MLPRTTVICAVWHGDQKRRALLEGHAKTLHDQSRAVERLYVFDNGDAPPDNLDGRSIIAPEPLTIYQAWNVALAAVRTPYVMNLNLDDRLAPDAVAVLEAALDDGADLAGGDWRVCYTQEDTDFVEGSFEAEDWPFEPGWPPVPQTVTRLGSGTGQRGTLGPAVMWRVELHRAIGKYPDHFGDGSPIRVIGDAAWWRVLLQNKKRLVRVPLIIGNYHSHPSDQAEFRARPGHEEETIARVGVRLEPWMNDAAMTRPRAAQ